MSEIRDEKAEEYCNKIDNNVAEYFKAGFDCRDKLDNENVTYETDKLQKDAQDFINKFRIKMKDISEEILGEIYVNVGPYVETDQWTNYRESLRLELEREYKFSTFKKEWATNFRRVVFVENREEISKLISDDILKMIKHLEDCKQEFEQFRYTPLGDTYQDLKKKNTQTNEALKVAVEALEWIEAGLGGMFMDNEDSDKMIYEKSEKALAKIKELTGKE
jgi:hypothetical protein